MKETINSQIGDSVIENIIRIIDGHVDSEVWIAIDAEFWFALGKSMYEARVLGP